MKRIKLLIAISIVSLFAACHNREIAYLSDAERDAAKEILDVYNATIMPGDQLYIYVESKTPESVIPFNQETHKFQIEIDRQEVLDTTHRAVVEQKNMGNKQDPQYITTEVAGYFVSEKGTIIFPILGELLVVGITQDSLCRLVEQRLINDGLVRDPRVTSRLMNFRVTVVGEVRSPQQIHVEGTRLTILEALAICGDLTEYGRRDNLTIIRSDNKKQEIAELDLTKKEMLDSPFYYLHNNDIVYVEPVPSRKRIADRNEDIPKYISIGVSVGSIITTNLNNASTRRRMNQ